MITTAIANLILLQSQPGSAKEVFLKTMDHYSQLNSFSADLEHDYSSGLFPGKYRQHLEFKKGNIFSLLVTSHKGSNRPNDIAPDYISDGTDVMTKVTHEGTRALNKDPNISPGYEVSGGLIMTWLLNSPTKAFFTKPPSGMKVDTVWGNRKSWHGAKVEEIIMKIEVGDQSNEVSLFVDPNHQQFVGMEAMNNKKLGFMIYHNQKEN